MVWIFVFNINFLDDGCSSTCLKEHGYTCLGEPSICTFCGNGEVEGKEKCDDGNSTDCRILFQYIHCLVDGCSSTCLIETGYTCEGSPSNC